MKKLFYYSSIVISMVLFYSCQSEEISEYSKDINNHTNNVTFSSKEEIFLTGGDLITIDNYLVWIDPELVHGDTISSKYLVYEKTYWYGFRTGNGSYSGIACPTDGDNCGRVLEVKKEGEIPVQVGVYLIE